MREIYLGDSYDLIKRFWAENLSTVAPLYAHSRFVPQKIREQYTKVTGVPVVESIPENSFGLLLDPHTGIPLPAESGGRVTVSHAPLGFVVHVDEELHPKYMICFDQSFHRRPGLSKQEQRRAKQRFLSERGILSFYYVSHAPFLFAASKGETLDAIYEILMSLGLPDCRFERGA